MGVGVGDGKERGDESVSMILSTLLTLKPDES